MKKILALISLIFILTLCACGEKMSTNSPKLTSDEALDIALKQAGVTRDDIRHLENNLDTENGVSVYEIEFKSENTEYSYDVNAETGEITEREHEDHMNDMSDMSDMID